MRPSLPLSLLAAAALLGACGGRSDSPSHDVPTQRPSTPDTASRAREGAGDSLPAIANAGGADTASAHDTTMSREMRKYRGPMFDIRYPASFSKVPTGEEDGVSFRSPDRVVTFYVYSPQWNGTSTYAVPHAGGPSEERITDSTTTRSGSIVTRRFTYASADGSGFRSFEDREDTLLNARRIFGIAYHDQASLARYRPLYVRFKESLIQYAD